MKRKNHNYLFSGFIFSPKGFTYVEVLVAIVIFSSTFVLITYLMMGSIENRRDAYTLQQATLLAQSKMDEIRKYQETKEENGKFKDESFSFEYTIKEIKIDFAKQAKELGLAVDVEEEAIDDLSTKQTSSLVTEIPIYLYKVNILYENKFVYSLLYFKRRRL